MTLASAHLPILHSTCCKDPHTCLWSITCAYSTSLSIALSNSSHLLTWNSHFYSYHCHMRFLVNDPSIQLRQQTGMLTGNMTSFFTIVSLSDRNSNPNCCLNLRTICNDLLQKSVWIKFLELKCPIDLVSASDHVWMGTNKVTKVSDVSGFTHCLPLHVYYTLNQDA